MCNNSNSSYAPLAYAYLGWMADLNNHLKPLPTIKSLLPFKPSKPSSLFIKSAKFIPISRVFKRILTYVLASSHNSPVPLLSYGVKRSLRFW